MAMPGPAQAGGLHLSVAASAGGLMHRVWRARLVNRRDGHVARVVAVRTSEDIGSNEGLSRFPLNTVGRESDSQAELIARNVRPVSAGKRMRIKRRRSG